MVACFLSGIFTSHSVSVQRENFESGIRNVLLIESSDVWAAIPVNLAKDVLTQLIEHGHVIRGWLGIKIQDITPKLAKAFELDSTDGVVINNIVVNGPADKAKLDRGDIITHINGKKVRDFRETLDKISMHKPGEQIKLTIIREGKKLEKMATVSERPGQ